MRSSLSAATRAAAMLAAAWLGLAAPAAGQTTEEVRAYAAWSQQVHAIVNDTTDLVIATEALDKLSRQVAAGTLKPKAARREAKKLIGDFKSGLRALKKRAAEQPAPPEFKDRADMNNANKWLYAHMRKAVAGAEKILTASEGIFESAMAGDKDVEQKLAMQFSKQMIVLLDSENQTNRAALFSLPRDPLHPQYHFLSILIESNEAMAAIHEAIVSVGEGRDAAEAHIIMKDRIERAQATIATLNENGSQQVATYGTLFDKGERAGQIPKDQADLLRQMFATYARSFEIETQIIDAMAAYADLPNLAEQTDANVQQGETILNRIKPLADERTRLQAQRTELAGKI